MDNWFFSLKEGRIWVESEPRPGRPSTSTKLRKSYEIQLWNDNGSDRTKLLHHILVSYRWKRAAIRFFFILQILWMWFLIGPTSSFLHTPHRYKDELFSQEADELYISFSCYFSL